MKITREEVQGVAVLARLRLTAEEETRLTDQLDHILDYMQKLNELDTTNIEPFHHASEFTSALREDVVTNRPDTDSLLANAPDRDATFFKVPKILE